VSAPRHSHPNRTPIKVPSAVVTLVLCGLGLAVALSTLGLVLTNRSGPKVPAPVLITVQRTQLVTVPRTRTVTVTPNTDQNGNIPPLTTFGSG
jgi:hypothetical protein